MKSWDYSEETMQMFHKELHAYLDEHGPCTRSIILRGLKWSEDRFRKVQTSHPEWLVIVDVAMRKSNRKSFIYHCRGEHIFGYCPECGKRNYHPGYKDKPCRSCTEDFRKEDSTYMLADVDPYAPTEANPGSEDKMSVLMARYDLGLPLWNDGDKADYETGQDRPVEPDDPFQDSYADFDEDFD